MTIHSKTNPIGLDLQLQRIQKRIDSIGWGDIDVYGKLQINEKNKGVKVIEAHIGSGEYKDVFVDDTKNAVFGFLVSDNRDKLAMIKCNVRLICSCRVDKIYNTTETMDEETILDVLKVISEQILQINQNNITTGFDSVFEGVSIEKFKFRNRYPWFNFSISFMLSYKY